MKYERRELEQLFAPPPNQYGTHMLICGLSADTETLERIVSTFTGENPVERAANGLLRAALMLDASAPQLGRLAVPGMLQLASCERERWTAQTSLLHAKVALLGFADAKFAAPTSFRLLVSTGNWTRETWGNGTQIDLFWSAECGTDAAAKRTDAFADVSAAFVFFERLLQALYPHSAAFLSDRPLAMGWLKEWRATLSSGSRNKKSRFVHSLDQSLFTQIKQRFPQEGVSTLVAGSGFWEQVGRDAGTKPEVLQQLDKLEVRGERYLVSNPKQAGALATWVHANPKAARKGRIDGWTLCAPRDPLQTPRNAGRTFLHAKYVAGLTRVATSQNDKGTMTFLYLGSGNLSRAGFLSKAALGSARAPRQGAGNIEAGVLMTERQEVTRVWHALACGDILSPNLVKSMETGPVDAILVPRDPPPVLFAQVVGTRLALIRSASAHIALEARLDATGPWLSIDANDELALSESVPPLIWVRTLPTQADDTPEIYEVPVLTEDGVCCRQAPNALNVDDVLEALLAFPSAPPHLPDPDPPQPSTTSSTSRPSAASQYPLKLMAELVEAIGQRNAVLTQEQFPVWLSQLRFLMLEQVTEADRNRIRRIGVNLFPALLHPGFAPAWLNQTPHLAATYRQLVSDIEALWTLPSAMVCPGPAQPFVNQGESLEEQT